MELLGSSKNYGPLAKHGVAYLLIKVLGIEAGEVQIHLVYLRSRYIRETLS